MINYSNEQQEVVNFRSGFMRVTAPAGSGKTQTMAGLITGLVNEGVPEGKILATTFSNAGVKEMKHKFSRELGHECGIDVCTINSKQFEIVKDNYAELGFAKKPNVIDVVQRYAIIADLLAKYPILEWRGNSFLHFIPSPIAKGRSALEIVSNIFSAAKKSGKGIDEVGYNDVADIIIGTDISIQATNKILKLFRKYDEQLKEKGLVDFDDQEVLSFRLLEDHPGYLDKYGYQYVIIDEFQDTSLTQMEFVKYLKNMKSLKGLAVVGDPAQAIYGFRDTSPEYIINFEEYLNKPFQHVSASKSALPDNPAVSVQNVELTKNFRSYQEILDLGEEVLKCNKGDVLHVNAQRGTSGIRPIVNGYISTKDEYADIVRIAGLLHEQGTAWEDICVLATTKEELSGIADAATRAGIPSFFGAPELMSKNPRIQAILAFYDVLNDPSNTASLVVAANAAAHGALSNPEEYDSVEAYKEVLNNAKRDVLGRVSNIKTAASDEAALSEFLRYLDDIACGDEVLDNFRTALEGKDFLETLQYCLDFRQYGAAQEFRRLTAEPGIFLTTAHSSKGLEWKYVFVVSDKFLRSQGGHELSKSAMEERRRLAYVAITRARDQVYVTGTWYERFVGDDRRINYLLQECMNGIGESFVPQEPARKAVKKMPSRRKKTA